MSARLHLWGLMRSMEPGQAELLEAGMFSRRSDRHAITAAGNMRRKIVVNTMPERVFHLRVFCPGIIQIERTV